MPSLSDWYVKNLNWKGKHREGVLASIVGVVAIMPANPARVYASIVNNSLNWVYLSKTENLGVVNQGIPLAPLGGSYEINLNNPYFGPLCFACGAIAANAVCWTEDE